MEQRTERKPEEIQYRQQDRFHDAVDAISALMFYPDQYHHQHDIPENLMEIGTRMWNEYLMDGWMMTEVGKMKKEIDRHRIVQLFRRCLNRRRYDLIQQLAHLNVSNYKAFLTAIGTKGEPEEDEYFTKDGNILWSNSAALQSFADLSNATITIFGEPTIGSTSNIFQYKHALFKLLELLPFVANLQIADRNKLYDDFSNITLPDILENSRGYITGWVTFLLETFETINDYYMQTNHTVPSLEKLCMRYVHYKFVGPQASPYHRMITYAHLNIPPSITWNFVRSTELCWDRNGDTQFLPREIVWKVYELYNDYKVDFKDLTILANHPDLKDSVSVDVFDNVLKQSSYYSISTVEKQVSVENDSQVL